MCFLRAAVGTVGRKSRLPLFLQSFVWRYVQIRKLRFVSVYKNLNVYANKEFIPCSFSFYLYFGDIMVCVEIQSEKKVLYLDII